MRRSLRLAATMAFVAAAGLAAVALPRLGGAPHAAIETESGPLTTGALPARAPAAPAPAAPAPAVTPTAERDVVPQSNEAIHLSFAPIVKRVAPAVVNVYATARVKVRSPFEGDPFFERFFGGGMFGSQPRERERSSLGSGVIVDASGVVVTNHHVIKDATEVKVALSDGREYPATILLRDERTDLAVLKIDNAGKDFPVLHLGESDGLQVGDLVLAVGNPFGVGQTVTSGIVSAVARSNLGINDSGSFIQTDAAINPGNSGGALVDMDGDLIGINTAIYSRSGGSIGIGFAIPSDMVKTVVAQALAGSKSVARPWIGVLTQNVTPDIASAVGLDAPRGAVVFHIDKGSPAEKAGLAVNDVIEKASGRDVIDSAAFDYRLAVAGIGKPMQLSVWRDGALTPITITTEAEPKLDEADFTLIGGRSPLTGAVVADFSATLADRMDIKGADGGAVIVDIEPRSPAAQMGFRPGDVILRAQDTDVASAKALADLVETPANSWQISFNRNGRVRSVVIGG